MRPADAWIDPSQPKARALVTHGHADHARGGHGAVLATPETLAIMETRYGPQIGPGRSPMTRRSASARSTCASSPPAMCSARRRSCSSIRASGSSSRATTSAGPTRPARCFVPVPCDIFITEATFGLPVFRHPDTGSEIDRLLHRLHADPSRCVLVGAYALGKAQRIITELRARGHHEPIYFHGAIERLNQLYEELRRRARRASPRRPARPRRRWRAISSSPRRARSTTAGRGACPTRSRRWPRAGCASASAPASATSSCR